MEDVEEKSRNSAPVAPVILRAELDTASIRAKWERSQKDLDREKQSRRAEAVHTAARLEELQSKLRNTAEALERARASESGRGRLALVVAACIVLLLATLWIGYTAINRASTSPVQSIVRPVRRPANPASIPHGAFSSAASRLSDALASVPGRSPEEILRVLNARSSNDGPVCPIEWNGAEPAVVFGSNSSHLSSLDAALTRCAEAVEQIPR